MHYRIFYVGRSSTDPLCAAAQAYQERLSRYVKVSAVQVRDQGSAAQQGERLADLLRRDAPPLWVALDETGPQLTTLALAQQLATYQERGLRQLAFVLGGADGLDPALLARAPVRLALSRLTLPHRLARVVLTEQLYRAHALLQGSPYHRQGPPKK